MDPYYYRWKKIQKGDIKTFEKLYNKHFHKLLTYAFRILKDEFLSEEVVQDVFLKIWQKRDSIKINGSISGYLYSATHNFAINAAIQQKTNKNKVNQIVSEEIWRQIQNSFVVTDHVSKNIEEEEIESKVRSIIETLPKQCKTVFKLSRFENLTNEEIAEKLNISKHTVRAHLYHALEKITKILEK